VQTTLRFDDVLMRRAKAAAAAEGSSLTSYISEAVRAKLDHAGAKPRRRKKISFPTFDTGGLLPGVPPIHDSRALNDYLDEVDGPGRR
jgi:hypothetical protein